MGVTFWRRLTLKITAVVGVMILIGCLLYAFRQPIAVAVLEHFGAAQNIEVSCLEVELHLDLSLSIDELCLVGPALKLQLHDALWAYNTNQLVIDDLAIQHLPNPHGEEKSAETEILTIADFSLPAYLPRLTVNQVQLQSPVLTGPIHFRVEQPNSTRFILKGDVQAQATLDQGILKLDVVWTLAEVLEKFSFAQKLKYEQNPLLSQDMLVNAPIHTKLLFDGQRIDSQHLLDMESIYTVHDNCHLRVSIQGTLAANVNLANKDAVADLSALDSHMSVAKNCWQAVNPSGISFPQRLKIEFKDNISLDMHGIVVPQMRISDGKTGQITAQLKDLYLPITPLTLENPLQGAFSLLLNLPGDTEPPQAGTATLRLAASGQGEYAPDHWQLVAPNNTLSLEAFSQGLSLAKANAQFTAKLTNTEGMTLHGQAAASGLSYVLPAGTVSVKSLTSQFSANAMNLAKINVELQNTLTNTHYQQFVFKTLTNQLELTLDDLDKVTVKGLSNVNGIAIDVKDGGYLLLGKLRVDHNLTANRTSGQVTSEHQVLLDEQFSALINQQQQRINISVAKQSVSGLNPALHTLVSDATLTDGLLSANLVLDLASLTGQGTFDLQELSARYQDFAFAGLTTSAAFTLDSAGLQLDDGSLTLDTAQVGLPITDIQGQYKVLNSQVKITGVTANLLGGSAVTKDLWLDGREQTTVVQISHIDLAKVAQLQQQPGIELSGEIQGTLPLTLTAQGIIIAGGRIASEGPGKLRIKDNPAFESIKAQQSELAYLQDLDFKQLTSNVRLDTDGWLFLDFSILGSNAELGQAVNFNYSHEENILTLLSSLRLTDTVQNKIEQKIKQGGEK
jgi:hypothetical protein